MMRSIHLILIFLVLSVEIHGQGLMDRKRPELIPGEGKVRRGGFYFAPGVTYLLPRSSETDEEIFRNADTTYLATYDPSGKIGLYLEAGWFHATRDPVILDYWDFGLAYKNFRGYESTLGLVRRGELTDSLFGEGDF